MTPLCKEIAINGVMVSALEKSYKTEIDTDIIGTIIEHSTEKKNPR